MKKITFIVGLPGSGKTSLAQQMLGPGDVLLDDFSRDPAGFYAIGKESVGRLIITDPNACFAPRDAVLGVLTDYFGEADITIIAFENDPEACWSNLLLRDDSRAISKQYIITMSRKYNPAQWSDDIRPVYRGM